MRKENNVAGRAGSCKRRNTHRVQPRPLRKHQMRRSLRIFQFTPQKHRRLVPKHKQILAVTIKKASLSVDSVHDQTVLKKPRKKTTMHQLKDIYLWTALLLVLGSNAMKHHLTMFSSFYIRLFLSPHKHFSS